MTTQEAAFAVQKSLDLVKEQMEMIKEFGLDAENVYDRVYRRMAAPGDKSKPASAKQSCEDERREQGKPISG